MSDNHIQFVDYVRDDLILLNVEGDTRDEVLNNISKVLIEKKIVKESFAEGLLKEKMSTRQGFPSVNIMWPFPTHIRNTT